MDADKIISLFSEQIQGCKTVKAMHELLSSLLKEQANMSEKQASSVVNDLKDKTKGMSKRADIVEQCRQLLSSLHSGEDSDTGDVESSADDESASASEKRIVDSIHQAIKDDYPELRKLSEPARTELEHLVCEMVARYQIDF